MTCADITSAHDWRAPVSVYTVLAWPNQQPEYDIVLCDPCAARIAEYGIDIRPGRMTDIPVLRDRRAAREQAA